MKAGFPAFLLLLLPLLPDGGCLPQQGRLFLPSAFSDARNPPVDSIFRLRGGKDAHPLHEGPNEIAYPLTSNLDLGLWLSVSKGQVFGIKAAVRHGADVNKPLDWLAEFLPESAVCFPTVPPSSRIAHRDCRPTGMARGWRPMHLACWLGMDDVVEALLKEGANVTVASSLGTTPMHLAAHGLYVGGRSFGEAMAHYARVMNLLARAGADIEARDAAGYTPLMMAARHNRPNLIMELLDRGADATVVDKSGVSALEHAQELSIHPALRNATVHLLKTAAALKKYGPNSPKERWHLGIAAVIWKTGFELTLHLFGMYGGFRVKRGDEYSDATKIMMFFGRDPWRRGDGVLKTGWWFALRGMLHKVNISDPPIGNLVIPEDLKELMDVVKEHKAQAEAELAERQKAIAGMGIGEQNQTNTEKPLDQEERAQLDQDPPPGDEADSESDYGEDQAVVDAVRRADPFSSHHRRRSSGKQASEAVSSEEGQSASTIHLSTEGRTVSVPKGLRLTNRSVRPQTIRKSKRVDSDERYSDSIVVERQASSSSLNVADSRCEHQHCDEDEGVFYESAPSGSLEDEDLYKDSSFTQMQLKSSQPGCARLSRRGIWSCMWCLFPGFGKVVPKSNIWDT